MKKTNWSDNIKRIFLGSTFRRNATLLSLGNVFLLVLQTCFYPLAARLYDEAVFGEFALVQSITYLFGFLMTLKYEAAILTVSSEEEAHEIKDTIFSFSVLFFIIVLVLMISLPDSLYRAYLDKKYIMAIPVFMLSFAANQVFRHWFLRSGKITFFLRCLFGQKVISILTSLLFAFITDFYNGIILGHLLGTLVFLGLVTLSPEASVRLNYSSLWNVIRKHDHFLKFLLPTSIFQMGGTHFPFLLTNHWFGVSVTGLLSMAMQVLHLPQTVLFSKLSESLHQRFQGENVDKRALKSYILKIWKHLALLMILPSLSLIFWGESIFSLILGSHWRLAGEMTTYLGVAMFTSSFAGVVYNVYIILDRQKLLMFLQLLKLAVAIAAFSYGGFTGSVISGVQVFVPGIVLYHFLVCVNVWRMLER